MTTQEIVKALITCGENDSCDGCPMFTYPAGCVGRLHRYAADVIESMTAELEQVKRERNAAIKDANSCRACKHAKPWNVNSYLVSCDKLNINKIATGCPYFEWRGPCAQNGGAE